MKVWELKEISLDKYGVIVEPRFTKKVWLHTISAILCYYNHFSQHSGSILLKKKSKIGFLNPKESENIFCVSVLNRSLRSWCVKGTEESTSTLDSSVHWTHHDPRDLRLICLVKNHNIHFRIVSDLKIQSWIILKHTLRVSHLKLHVRTR